MFGFDSGIAKGGVALYYPDNGKWEFVFLRPKGYLMAQFAEFKKLRDLYVGVLGYPGSVIVSRNIDACTRSIVVILMIDTSFMYQWMR